MKITNSSSISSISDVSNDQVTIVFKSSDKEYTYKVTDLEAWQNDLNDVISEGESVGKFVNRAIGAKILELV